MKQILLAYCLAKEFFTDLMMLDKNTKVMVRSPDGDSQFFDIFTGVMKGYTLELYIFILYQDSILRTSKDQIKENDFTLKKTKSRRYPTETMIDVDYADDLALFTNILAHPEFLLHSREEAEGGIGIYVNTNKTEYISVKQEEAISTLSGKPLEFDQFTYLDSKVMSTYV